MSSKLRTVSGDSSPTSKQGDQCFLYGHQSGRNEVHENGRGITRVDVQDIAVNYTNLRPAVSTNGEEMTKRTRVRGA